MLKTKGFLLLSLGLGITLAASTRSGEAGEGCSSTTRVRSADDALTPEPVAFHDAGCEGGCPHMERIARVAHTHGGDCGHESGRCAMHGGGSKQDCGHAASMDCCDHGSKQDCGHASMDCCDHGAKRDCGHASMDCCDHGASKRDCGHASMDCCDHGASKRDCCAASMRGCGARSHATCGRDDDQDEDDEDDDDHPAHGDGHHHGAARQGGAI